MAEASGSKDQQHPLHNRDRPTIDILLAQEPTDYNLAELARLKIRYQGFPGARDIQQDLDKAFPVPEISNKTWIRSCSAGV